MRAHQSKRPYFRNEIDSLQENNEFTLQFKENNERDNYSCFMSQRDAYDNPPPIMFDFQSIRGYSSQQFDSPFNVNYANRRAVNYFDGRMNRQMEDVEQQDTKVEIRRDMSIEQPNKSDRESKMNFGDPRQIFQNLQQNQQKGVHWDQKQNQNTSLCNRQQGVTWEEPEEVENRESAQKEIQQLYYEHEESEHQKQFPNTAFETPCGVDQKKLGRRKRIIDSSSSNKQPRDNNIFSLNNNNHSSCKRDKEEECEENSIGKRRKLNRLVDSTNIIANPSSKKRLTRKSLLPTMSSESPQGLHAKFEAHMNSSLHKKGSPEQYKKLRILVKNKRRSEQSQLNNTASQKKRASQGTKTCAICLSSPEENIIGVIECSHEFCWDCILQWSQVTNQCPMCRAEFSKIRKKNYNDEEDQEVIEVDAKKQRIPDDDEFYWEEGSFLEDDGIDEICYVCETDQDEHKLIVCDHCGVRICHTYCDEELLDDSVPDEDWFCHECRIRSELFN